MPLASKRVELHKTLNHTYTSITNPDVLFNGQGRLGL